MPRPLPQLIARLRRVARPREATDGDALTRFARGDDPDAFAHLVRRFGPMVRAVCRRQLGDTPDADDAYQATFLVLVRKARTVKPPEAVGSWLFAVAHRTAVYSRTVMHRRAAKLRPLTVEPSAAPLVSSDLMTALDAELATLPDKFRDAVVLCELDGRSLKDAAEAVGVPVGTLASRLARGRLLLADRLRAKGFAVTAAAVSGLLAAGAADATASEFDPSAPAAGPGNLASGVMKMALLSKLKLTTAVGMCVIAVGVFGVGLLPGLTPVTVAHAAPVPKDDKLSAERKKELDELWGRMNSYKPDSTQAAFLMAKHPQAVTYLKERMKPLKLGEKEAKQLIAKLFAAKDDELKEVEQDLAYRSPLLAMPMQDVWNEASSDDDRRRLAFVLLGRPQGHENDTFNLRADPGGTFHLLMTAPGGRSSSVVRIPHTVAECEGDFRWQTERRAIFVLEQIGTPEAVKVIEGMATGHPDAAPTVSAKEALERLKKK